MERLKPILFNTEMVRATLNDLKTATRRVIKPRYRDDECGFQILTHLDGRFERVEVIDDNEFATRWLDPPYCPGGILYVRETWAKHWGIYWHKAGPFPVNVDPPEKWRPSIHMPKEAARLFLRVTDVRVERLQDIDTDGIRAEGIATLAAHVGDGEISRQEFSQLWDSTIKPADRDRYGWNANPWVWVIEFERISKETALQAQKGGEG